jgi:hypothetical protein
MKKDATSAAAWMQRDPTSAAWNSCQILQSLPTPLTPLPKAISGLYDFYKGSTLDPWEGNIPDGKHIFCALLLLRMRIDVEASKDTVSAVRFGQQLYEVVSRIDADLEEILEHNVEDKVRVKDKHGLTFEWAGWVRNLGFCATKLDLPPHSDVKTRDCELAVLQNEIDCIEKHRGRGAAQEFVHVKRQRTL